MIDFIKVKQAVSCGRLLADQGCQPAAHHSGYDMYHSPLRDGDANPSFSVTADGRWRDHAIGQGGDVIDLAVALGLAASPREAAELLADRYGVDAEAHYASKAPPTYPQRATGVTEIRKVGPLQDGSLIDYIASRGIPENVAKYFLREVRYRVPSGSEFFAAGLKNENGGFAVRNKYFKGNVGPAGVTVLGGVGHGTVEVFEGAFDFLSWAMETNGSDGDAVVLNSISNIPSALHILDRYDQVNAYLDRDSPGAGALLRLKRDCSGNVSDCSERYYGYTDYNEYWKQRHRITNEKDHHRV